MVGSYIRLNNKFIYKKGKKYYKTNISKRSEWLDMNDKQKDRCKKEEVTKLIKELLKKHGSKSNMNFRTGKTKRKIKTKRLKRKNKKTKKVEKRGGSS